MSEGDCCEVPSDLGAQSPEPASNEAAQKLRSRPPRGSSTMNRRMLPQRPCKHKGGFQKRIDELTRQREEERREKTAAVLGRKD